MIPDPRHPYTKVGIALSGGGAKGDFEVGVLRYLLSEVGRPHVVTGTSVGAINAVKTAEGGDSTQVELEQIWLGLRDNSGMYVPRPEWVPLFNALASSTSGGGFSLDGVTATAGGFLEKVGGFIAPVSAAAEGILPAASLLYTASGPLAVFASTVAGGMVSQLSTELVQQLLAAIQAPSLYSLQPIRDLARGYEMGWSPAGPGVRGAGVAVGQRSDGRVVLLARGVDDGLYSSEERAVGGASEWTPWALVYPGIISDPAVATDISGAITGVTAVVNGGHMRMWPVLASPADGPLRWTGAEGQELGWSPGDVSGEGVAPDGSGRVPWANRPTIVHRTDVDASSIVAIASDLRPYRLERTDGLGPAWYNPGWGFDSVGDRFVGALAALEVGNVFTAVGRVQNYGVRYLSTGNGLDRNRTWRVWPGQLDSDPVLVFAGNHLEVFGRGMDRGIWRRRQTDPAHDAWADWESLGGRATSNITVGKFLDGRLELYVRGIDFAIWKIAQSVAGGPFDSGWASLGAPPAIKFLGDPVAFRRLDGRMQLFAVGNDLAVWTVAQNAAGGGWTSFTWQSLGGRVFTGVQLRLAMVQLESGELRHVNEAGLFVDDPGAPGVSRADAAIASSSIPGVFEPVKLNDRIYVDGGMRSITPIQAAIEAGADVVYAAISSNPEAGDKPSFAQAGLIDNVIRGLVGIMTDAVMENELSPPQGWSKPVKIIQPTSRIPYFSDPALQGWLEAWGWQAPGPPQASRAWTRMVPPPPSLPQSQVHDAFTIDPGRIRISMDYGYMRAYDVVSALDPAGAKASSDAIVVLRSQVWALEEIFLAACAWWQALEPAPSSFITLDGHLLDGLRRLKMQLGMAVDRRRGRGEALAAGADNWSRTWEAHASVPPAGSPFDGFVVSGAHSGSATFAGSATPLASQWNWKWCNKCQGLSYAGNATTGPCPAGGVHDHAGSSDYGLLFGDAPIGQGNWRHCNKCQGLWFAGEGSQGRCPSGPPGTTHESSSSYNYQLLAAGSGWGQNNWRQCTLCLGLTFAGNAAPGRCPGGLNHQHPASRTDFVLYGAG